jgi:hypothetical protein
MLCTEFVPKFTYVKGEETGFFVSKKIFLFSFCWQNFHKHPLSLPPWMRKGSSVFRKAHNPFTHVKLINTLVYLHRV